MSMRLPQLDGDRQLGLDSEQQDEEGHCFRALLVAAIVAVTVAAAPHLACPLGAEDEVL
jgi:hypothetical protein